MSYIPMRAALGATNPLLDAARYEVTSAVQHTVIGIFERYVLPVVIGSTILSLFAFGMALASYRRTFRNNPRRRRPALAARSRRRR